MQTKSNKIKLIAMVACIVLVIAVAASASVAYIIDRQASSSKYDMPAFELQFIGNENMANESVLYKSNVSVYIRFAISCATDVNSILVNDANWQQIGSYYYYMGILPASETGEILYLPVITINSDTVTEYKIVTEICQTDPDTAAKESWGVMYDGFNGWVSVNP